MWVVIVHFVDVVNDLGMLHAIHALLQVTALVSKDTVPARALDQVEQLTQEPLLLLQLGFKVLCPLSA